MGGKAQVNWGDSCREASQLVGTCMILGSSLSWLAQDGCRCNFFDPQ